MTSFVSKPFKKFKHTLSRREFLGEEKWLAEKTRLRANRSKRHQRNSYKKKRCKICGCYCECW